LPSNTDLPVAANLENNTIANENITQAETGKEFFHEMADKILSDSIPGLPDKPTFRVSEVANYFDVSERTVYLWIEHGHLAIEYTPAGQKRITRESINSCRFKPKKHVNNLPDNSQDS